MKTLPNIKLLIFTSKALIKLCYDFDGSIYRIKLQDFKRSTAVIGLRME